VIDSWAGFWVLLLVSGAFSGVIAWWLGGWWFALRLRWSGATDPDRRLARLVMVYSAFVFSGPVVFASLVRTLAFEN